VSDLAGQWALVTGAGKRVGRSIALALARRGAQVVGVDGSEELVLRLLSALPRTLAGVLAGHGRDDVAVLGNLTTEDGTTAADWASATRLAAIADELAHPEGL